MATPRKAQAKPADTRSPAAVLPQPLSQVNNPGALMGERLTQIIARHLAPRAAHFRPLRTLQQVYPSYFEAPVAARALLPDGMVFAGCAAARAGPPFSCLRPSCMTSPQPDFSISKRRQTSTHLHVSVRQGRAAGRDDGILRAREPAAARGAVAAVRALRALR